MVFVISGIENADVFELFSSLQYAEFIFIAAKQKCFV